MFFASHGGTIIAAYGILIAMSVIFQCNAFGKHYRLLRPFVGHNTKSGRCLSKSDATRVNKYSHTIFLPSTTFEQRANAAVREKEIQEWWEREKVYDSLRQAATGPKFVLHDGPPYANGDLHIGHALNKILKDFVNRYQMLHDKKVTYVPGWDCHGLPIEHKVLQNLSSSERKSLDPVKLRQRAGEFAKETVKSQMAGFKRFGVWGDWDKPYLTMDPQYEAAQIRAFGKMVEKGFVYRGLKPVHWSPSSQSALAEAELEYPDNHTSTSIYLGFEIVKPTQPLVPLSGGKNIKLVIWTTTPWTIPANMAVAVNDKVEYAVVEIPGLPDRYIVASDLVGSVMELLKIESEPVRIGTILGSELSGTIYQHPLHPRTCPVVVGGDYINTLSGTGLVHTAPGHGHDDYATCLNHGIPPFSPVDDKGIFTSEAGAGLEGLDVLGSGNKAVISQLGDKVLIVHPYCHKYPYDWRTKKPTIVRATEQWFANLNLFRDDAITGIDTVAWVPAAGKNRITAMVNSRTEWCISRQRSWGVPIPVFYHKSSGQALMNESTINHIADLFEMHGSDCWWKFPVDELLPPGSLRDSAAEYVKGTDTMDVWFDSGTSWSGVLQSRENLTYPADLYLEGSDQHRGWFQSSLLTSVAVNGISPYKTVLTHGFVLDEKGMKMSKSLGNVVDPMSVIEGGKDKKKNPAYGADTLRLWVSSVDYTWDVCIGDNIIKLISDSYRKIRNTFRFMVGSLSDFDPATNVVCYESMPSIDKYILGRLSEVKQEVEAAFEGHHYFKVYQLLLQFLTTDLSAFYLDIVKDRLYISRRDDLRRRSGQTVIHYCMEQIAIMVSPLTPHLAEDLWQHVPYAKTHKSIFQKQWPKSTFPSHGKELWGRLKKLRNDANKAMEVARTDKLIGASQESRLLICCSEPSLRQELTKLQGHSAMVDSLEFSNLADDLRFILMTSEIIFVVSEDDIVSCCKHYILAKDSESGVSIGVQTAKGKRCERCWYYSDNVGHNSSHSDMCLRCCSIVSNR